MSEKWKIYEELIRDYEIRSGILRKRYNLLGLIRFIVMLAIIVSAYYYIKSGASIFLLLSLAGLVLFILMVKFHQSVLRKRKLADTHLSINRDEYSFLRGNSIPFDPGEEYINTKHAYSFDLDFFGKNSLFHNINRTATYIGKTSLANFLKSRLEPAEIKRNQDAIKELSQNLALRQEVYAYAKIADDSEDVYNKLAGWIGDSGRKSSAFLRIVTYVSPLVLILMIILYFTEGLVVFRTLSLLMFLLNIGILVSKQKDIKKELISSTKIDDIFRNYSFIIQAIDNSDLHSEKLTELKNKLNRNDKSAAKEIRKLSSLFSQLDSLFNLIAAAITNGLGLYHIHVLRALQKWKTDNARYVLEWLDVIGEFEALGSVANFSANNPSFTFPELNDSYKIDFEGLGHPLIHENHRVVNDVSFSERQYIILTGSNMSGKSTFLRSLGLNMVLAGAGAPVCASHADIHPMDVLVSMRVSDSLVEDESYFLAEVKRLKEIMDHLSGNISFVLLDEILRGTNSDDKHYGTVEVIKKIKSYGAFGAIATHDLKVCKITDDYPEELTNKCFEVETIENELSFDYKLREGICENRSATFLMKKTGVI